MLIDVSYNDSADAVDNLHHFVPLCQFWELFGKTWEEKSGRKGCGFIQAGMHELA